MNISTKLNGGASLLTDGLAAVCDALATAWAKRRAMTAERRERDECAAVARTFNNRYCYRREYVKGMDYLGGTHYGFPPRGGYAWMCPNCNKIHHPEKNSVFSGLQYPACCLHGVGHRLSDEIKTGD